MELELAREWIRARRRRAKVNAERQPGGRGAVIRCTDPHRRANRPKVAEMSLVDGGVLFVSRIKWEAGDMTALPGWRREELLGGVADLVLNDDRQLQRWLDDLADWTQGREPSGPRWMAGQRPFEVFEWYAPEAEPGELTPWVRCPEHGEAIAVTREQMFGAFRN